MPDTPASRHADQTIPYEWRAYNLDGRTLIAHDVPEGRVDAYIVSDTSRRVRELAKADSVLYEGRVVEAVYNDDLDSVEFYHSFAGRVDRKPADTELGEPAFLLEELEETEVAP